MFYTRTTACTVTIYGYFLFFFSFVATYEDAAKKNVLKCTVLGIKAEDAECIAMNEIIQRRKVIFYPKLIRKTFFFFFSLYKAYRLAEF